MGGLDHPPGIGGLARKSWVVNGKTLQVERRDMHTRARMCPEFSAIRRRRAGPRGRSPAATPQATGLARPGTPVGTGIELS